MKWQAERKELIDKRDAELAAMRVLLGRETDGQQYMTTEEDQQYATHEAAVEAIQKEIEAGDAQARAAQGRQDRMAALERWDSPQALRSDPGAVMASDGALMQASAAQDRVDLQGRYLGLDGKTVRRYRMGAYMMGMLNGDTRGCGMEVELSALMRQRFPHLANQRGLIIPEEVLERSLSRRETRADSDQTDNVLYANDTALIATQFDAGSYVGTFWQTLVLQQATMISGMVGKRTIPRQTSRPVAKFYAESAAAGKSTPQWDNINLEPHRLTIASGYSGLMQAATPIDIENQLANDFAMAAARKLEYAFFHGSATLQEPIGLLALAAGGAYTTFPATSVVTLGAGANAGGAWTFDKVEEVITAPQLKDSNMGAWRWITHPKGASKMRRLYRQDGTDTPIWDYRDNNVYGYPGTMTTNISDKIKKGTGPATNSAAFFLNVVEAIFARFVGTSFIVDLSGDNALKDEPTLILHEYCDVDNRHPESFVIIPDIA